MCPFEQVFSVAGTIVKSSQTLDFTEKECCSFKSFQEIFNN